MARGLAARTQGDKFVDNENNVWELDNILTFPKQDEVCFDSVDRLKQSIQEFKETNKVDVKELNASNKSTKSAVLFTVKSDDTENTYLRYFKKFNKNGLAFNWGGKQLKDSTGLSIHTIGSVSEHLCIKPSEVIKEDKLVSPDETIDLINESVDLPEDFRRGTVNLLNGVLNNSNEFVEGMSKYRSAIEKYVGEYAAPMYLIKNQEQVKNNVSLFPSSIEFKKMFFPISGNWPLTDSMVYDESESTSLGISSKGGASGGAAASIKTISEIYKNDIDDSHPIKKEAKEVIDTIHIISDNSMVNGPIYAAINMGFITEEEAELVTHYVDKHANKPDGIVPDRILKLMNTIKPNMDHENYSIGLHMLSGIARSVCSKLNNNHKTTDVFKLALKSKNFVQIYARTEKKGDAIRFSNFMVIDPSNFKGNIFFSAQKPYMATTKPKGKITFKLKYE